MNEEGDELSSLSRDVLAKAREGDPPPEAMDALRRALAPQLGGGGGGGAATPRMQPRTWMWAAGSVTLAVMLSVAAWPNAPEVASTPRRPMPEASRVEVVPTRVEPAPATPETTPEQLAPPPRPRRENEPAYLDSIQRALESDPGRALRLAQRHHARFPEGLLGEEAEVLEIEAHARLGQLQLAQAGASAFYARHPSSPYRRRIDRALATPSQK